MVFYLFSSLIYLQSCNSLSITGPQPRSNFGHFHDSFFLWRQSPPGLQKGSLTRISLFVLTLVNAPHNILTTCLFRPCSSSGRIFYLTRKKGVPREQNSYDIFQVTSVTTQSQKVCAALFKHSYPLSLLNSVEGTME